MTEYKLTEWKSKNGNSGTDVQVIVDGRHFSFKQFHSRKQAEEWITTQKGNCNAHR